MKITLRFDGGCSGNGTARARGTFGWQVLDENHRLIGEGHGSCQGEHQTNNIAEYVGLIDGLRWISCLRPRVSEVLIEGDSKLVLETVNGRWDCKKDHLKKLRNEALNFLSGLNCEWSVQWIPRERNGACDELTRR